MMITMGEESSNINLEEACGSGSIDGDHLFTCADYSSVETTKIRIASESPDMLTRDSDNFHRNHDLLMGVSNLRLVELSDEEKCYDHVNASDDGQSWENGDDHSFEIGDDVTFNELLRISCTESLNSSNVVKNLCKCNKTDQGGSICPYCYLLQQNSPLGNKRKSQEDCDGLHKQMLLSKQLLEESTLWLEENKYRNFKRAKAPLSQDNSILEGDDSDELMLFTIQPAPRIEGSSEFSELHKRDVCLSDMNLIDLDEDVILSSCTFESLPTEIKLKIFSYFKQRDLCRYIAPVCSSWFHLSKDLSLWQRLSVMDYEDVSTDLLLRVISSWCRHLIELDLVKRSDISVTEFRELFQNCLHIQRLSVAFCPQINDEILGLIGTYCKRLTTINLEGCSNISDRSFYNFIGLPLTSVNVSHCNMLSDDGGVFLARNFNNLVEVNFDGIQWMSETFVKVLVDNHYGTLEKVFLDGENLDDDVVRQISRCKRLRALSFSFCTSMSHLSIEWVSQCRRLEHLQLRKGSNFTNAALLKYLKNMSATQGLAFRYLNLAECTEISDRCLFYLSERCPNIEVLDLSWCWVVSDDGLTHVIDNCKKLKEMTLKGLHELYGTPFCTLPKNLPGLKFLDLSQCNKIQDELIEFIVGKMKDLVIVNYYGEFVVNTRNLDAQRYINT